MLHHLMKINVLSCGFVFLPPRFTWEDDTLDPSREIWKENAPEVGGILFQFFLRYHTNFLIVLRVGKGKKRSQLNPKSLLSVGISPRLEILESGGVGYT